MAPVETRGGVRLSGVTLVHEQFGDGIISAINFKLDMRKVVDPDGGLRAAAAFDGKYLPAQPFSM
ncbi:cyanate lyase [Janthinobacterium sp. CG_S6]|nr:cyanate lyase [Janthinobacterium sp. CG_S6]